MQLGSFFSLIRESFLGRRIRNRISKWPSYQQIPQPYSLDTFAAKLRELLSLVSKTLTMDRSVKQRLLQTKSLKNTRSNPVLIIGGGPSARKLTVEQVMNFKASGGSIAVMNNFFRSEISQIITPDYYFAVDPEYWNPVFSASKYDRQDLEEYINISGSTLTVVQPVIFEPLSQNHTNYIYVDGRSTQGILRRARPDKPWGLPAAVALYSISTLKFLGHRDIYFTGLDSNFVNFFFVSELNNVVNRPQGQHFYEDAADISNALEPIDTAGHQSLPFRHLADLYYGHSIFLRDLYWLTKESCINVGNDESNDSAPRACLLPRSTEAL
jgi:hypothetical protein